MNKIFGVGWAKTGTTTLGSCFEILGYNHQMQDLDLVKKVGEGDLSTVMDIVSKKDTFEDWPWLLLYKEFDEQFPGNKFVLTKRNPEKWIKSYNNMLATQGDASEELNEIRRVLYGLPFPKVSSEQLLARYNQHNSEVEAYFRDRPGDLLIIDWEEGSDWKALCQFLGKEVPNMPIPHANRGSYLKNSTVGKLLRAVKNSFK